MTLADVQFTHHGQIVVAGVTGEIDLSNTAGIERVIAEAMTNEQLALILDLSRVDYLDSAGIRCSINCVRSFGSGRSSLVS